MGSQNRVETFHPSISIKDGNARKKKKKISKVDLLTLMMKFLLNRRLEGRTNFTSVSWSASSSNNKYEGNDTALLITVIVLAVIILLLLGGAGVAYLLYIRSVFPAHI
jgi:hypothetical protein